MTFQAHLENLRNKPEHVKKQIAFWSSFGITAIIFAFWIGSFTSVGQNAGQTVANAVERAGTPAQSLTASVGGLFDDIKNLIFTPRKITFTDIIVTPGK